MDTRVEPAYDGIMRGDPLPITAREANKLFAAFARAPALVLAVSGGPDSTALLYLAARWRKARKSGPALIAVTVDHGLRDRSAAEARAVKKLAGALGVTHLTKRWRGPKPGTGIAAAARTARYDRLAAAARRAKASHILTAHTLDDQAETVLMRLARGSGLTGLAAMAAASPRHGVILARPFLGLAKARLVATLDGAGIASATDPTNADPAYLRPRLRTMMPALAAEGLDAARLARLAGRMARADAALERMTDDAAAAGGLAADDFHGWPEEIRVRLLRRAIAQAGREGQAELSQIEALARAIADAGQSGTLRRTLAGALVALARGRVTVSAAPPRRVIRR